MNTTADAYRLFIAYQRAASAWQSARETDARFGRNDAAALLAPMRAAYAAYKAAA